MDMQKYEELKEMLCEELEKIVEKGELSAGSLETVHKLTDTIKNIGKIEMMDDEGGYSGDGEWEAMARGGRSYAGQRRDSRGRYSRAEGRNYQGGAGNYGGGSYRGGSGYSRAEGRDMMMERLGEMMEGADEKQREILKRAMRQLENA